MRDNGGWEMFRMIEIEKYPCNDRREADKKECEVMKELRANMNTYISYVSKEENKRRTTEYNKLYFQIHKDIIQEVRKDYHKEYRELNKEKIKINKKKYIEKNKEVIQNYQKEYNEVNKERLKEQKKQYRDLNKD